MKRTEALKLRSIIEQAAVSLDDQTASSAALLFPSLKGDGALIKTGTRINHGGVIKRANVDLWDTAENAPDAAPALWEDIDYRDGVRVIPAIISATAAFALDELGWWQGKVYKSLMHGNCWTPTQEPGQWEEVVT